MDKIILHVDLNNFYASVECLSKPHLADVPMAVCGNPDARHGIILAKNNIAKSLGIKTGDVIWQAKLKCPDLVTVSPHFDEYAKYSRIVRDIYFEFTDRIETFGLDECWLDVTASQKLFGSGKEIADKIREVVKQRTGLTVSVGVSFTKCFAKLGSDMKKPDATTVISYENYQTVVWNLPCSEMLNIGKKTAQKLSLLNIKTLGELAKADDKVLSAHFGINGQKIKNDALGIESSEVLKFDEHIPIKSVGNGTTTKRDMKSFDDVRTVIYFLCDTIASRLRQYGFMATGLGINFRNTSLTSFSRQKQLNHPTSDGQTLARTCFEFFKDNYDFKTMPPLRTLTVTTFNLVTHNFTFQTSLFDTPLDKRKEKIGASLDKIRSKYGVESITKAAFIDNALVGLTHSQDDDVLPFQRGNK